ncbi:PREDICTED: uncharacterized protein LOC108574519 isoform X2 [Habropoda laboriosa]|uniref:uncharacterized protein LOC108574519 isoform X2 n=1 Tax=Habropoda laboriosa TaxID=597456 RepID=UPI00083D5E68|nr:PREDICTED: uncharacterized protein LOC108574519 isoform X2 [Habropoda laboriosa]
MQSSYKAIIISVAVCAYEPPKDDPPCSCEHCNTVTKSDKEDDKKLKMYEEDSDGDGNYTICARDRDFNDRTFPNVCHMLCFNRCLILRYSTVTVNNTKKYAANAYRNNYYKLRDGGC